MKLTVRRTAPYRPWLLAGVLCGLLAACAEPPGGSSGPTARPVDGGVGTPDGGTVGTPFDGDGACAVLRGEVTHERRPVDVILVVDNSTSMKDEIVAIEANINVHLAGIVAQSGLDYRVILLSQHGDATTDQSVCITAPLSGHASCSPLPARPANTDRFFHYAQEIGSHDAYTQVLETYARPDPNGASPGGWSAWLRPDAFKTFIVVTDDEYSTKAGNLPVDEMAFDAQLRQLQPARFGDDERRDYVWHSIVGVAANTPATAPWLPGDAIHTGTCAPVVGQDAPPAAGRSYQHLSQVTGGLRYPICEYQGFAAIFQQIAARVVRSGKIACEFAVPPPPDGEKLDLEKIAVAYTDPAGAVSYYRQAATAAACVGGAFYVENGRVVLCPQTCAGLRADPDADLEVLFTCESTIL